MTEQDLAEVKWFDYRAASPETADLLFICEFARELSDHFKLMGGTGYVEHFFRKFDVEDYKASKMTPYFIKLRQWADSKMLRYQDFWAWAFTAYRDMAFKRVFVNKFLNKDLKQRVLEKSNNYPFMRFAEYKLYAPQNYCGLELQDDYYWYLVKQAQERKPTSWQKLLQRWCGEDKISSKFLKEKVNL